MKIEDVVGAAPTGDASTVSEWSTILLPTKVRFILKVWRYYEYRYRAFGRSSINDICIVGRMGTQAAERV